MVLEGRIWCLPGPAASEGGRSSLQGLLSPLNQPPPEKGREGGREGGEKEGREGVKSRISLFSSFVHYN